MATFIEPKRAMLDDFQKMVDEAFKDAGISFPLGEIRDEDGFKEFKRKLAKKLADAWAWESAYPEIRSGESYRTVLCDMDGYGGNAEALIGKLNVEIDLLLHALAKVGVDAAAQYTIEMLFTGKAHVLDDVAESIVENRGKFAHLISRIEDSELCPAYAGARCSVGDKFGALVLKKGKPFTLDDLRQQMPRESDDEHGFTCGLLDAQEWGCPYYAEKGACVFGASNAVKSPKQVMADLVDKGVFKPEGPVGASSGAAEDCTVERYVYVR